MLIFDIFFDFLSHLASINPHLPPAGGWGIDGWIRLDKINLISFSLIRVGFLDLCTSKISTSWGRKIRRLHVGKLDARRRRGRLRLLLWLGRQLLRGKTLDIYPGGFALALLDSLNQAHAFASVQLCQQLHGFVPPAVQVAADLIYGVLVISYPAWPLPPFGHEKNTIVKPCFFLDVRFVTKGSILGNCPLK